MTTRRWAEFLERADRWAPRGLLVLVALTLLAGLAYAAMLGNSLRYHDEREYLHIAEHLVQTGEYGLERERAYRPPFYPMFLAAFVKLGLGVAVMRLSNFLFLAASMWLSFRLVSRMTRPAFGLLAAAAFLAYPVLFYASGTLYPQIQGGFMLLFTVVSLTQPGVRTGALVAAGLCYGLLSINIPTFGPLSIIFLVWMLALRFRAFQIAAFFVPLLLPVVLWSLRNYAVFGEFAYVSTNSGVNMLLGNSPLTTADSGVNVDLSGLVPEGARGMGEVAKNRAYRSAAVQWIVNNPGDWFVLYVQKLVHYFAFEDKLATKSESQGWRTVVLGLTYTPLLLALFGRILSFKWKKWSPVETLIILLYVGNGFLAAVFFTRIRFRIPFDMLLISLVPVALSLLLPATQPAPSPANPEADPVPS